MCSIVKALNRTRPWERRSHPENMKITARTEEAERQGRNFNSQCQFSIENAGLIAFHWQSVIENLKSLVVRLAAFALAFAAQ
jgi:hypothetical protein